MKRELICDQDFLQRWVVLLTVSKAIKLAKRSLEKRKEAIK